MKKYWFFIISVLIIFGGQASLYFISKLLITDYHLIGNLFDVNTPFITWFIYFYMIWYPFEILTFYLVYKDSKKTYIKAIIVLSICLIIAQLTYYIYPTRIERPIVDTYNNLTTWIIYLTYAMDTPVNCLPSVHCIICFIAMFMVYESGINIKYKYLIYFINIMIVASTLLVKQHVLIDVILALIISIICYYGLSDLKIFKRFEKKLGSLT